MNRHSQSIYFLDREFLLKVNPVVHEGRYGGNEIECEVGNDCASLCSKIVCIVRAKEPAFYCFQFTHNRGDGVSSMSIIS